jgi:hypothetical protein
VFLTAVQSFILVNAKILSVSKMVCEGGKQYGVRHLLGFRKYMEKFSILLLSAFEGNSAFCLKR